MQGEKFYYQSFLENELSRRVYKNNSYSLRAYAKSLGLDAGALSRIIAGKKLISGKLVERILESLEFSPPEKQSFLISIAQSYEASSRERKPKFLNKLKEHTKKIISKDLSLDIFKFISDWYHYAILQLVKTKDFKHTEKDISKKLGLSQVQTRQAIERLKELELLKFEEGKLKRTSHQLTTGDLSLTNSALKKRIKQVSEKSIESLENDPIELRNHTTMTMAIDPEKIPFAKEMIQEFMDELSEALESENKTVYELQVNLFPLEK